MIDQILFRTFDFGLLFALSMTGLIAILFGIGSRDSRGLWKWSFVFFAFGYLLALVDTLWWERAQ